MTYRRLTLLPLLLIAAAALAACGGGSDDEGGEPQRIEDLPPESRLLVYAQGARPFDGSAEEYLAILPFEPLLPTSVPGDRDLAVSTIIPSETPRGKVDQQATLMLEYRSTSGESAEATGETEGDEATGTPGPEGTIQVTQNKEPMREPQPGLNAETVDVGGAQGQLVRFGDTEAIQLTWAACDRTISISTSVASQEEIVALGESMTSECPEPGEVG